MFAIGEVKQNSGIYLITNTVNGKVYVGSSIKLRKRMNKHEFDLNRCKHHCSHLQNAWNKYGGNNFSFTVVELIPDKNKLIQREQYWIDFYNACDKQKGYNINPTAGSTLGRKSTDKETQKRRYCHPKNKEILQFDDNGNFIKEWYSISEIAREINVERLTISYRIKSKRKFNNSYFIPKDEFSNELLDNLLKEKNPLRNGRKVRQYTLDGDFIKEWDSSTIAGETLNISRTGISSCCNGKYNSAGGYIWSYAE